MEPLSHPTSCPSCGFCLICFRSPNNFLKWPCMYVSKLSISFKVPYSVTREWMLFILFLILAVLWKNEVFASPSLSHLTSSLSPTYLLSLVDFQNFTTKGRELICLFYWHLSCLLHPFQRWSIRYKRSLLLALLCSDALLFHFLRLFLRRLILVLMLSIMFLALVGVL